MDFIAPPMDCIATVLRTYVVREDLSKWETKFLQQEALSIGGFINRDDPSIGNEDSSIGGVFRPHLNRRTDAPHNLFHFFQQPITVKVHHL